MKANGIVLTRSRVDLPLLQRPISKIDAVIESRSYNSPRGTVH